MSGLGNLIKNLFLLNPSDIISEKLPRAFNLPSFCECFVDNKKVSLTLRGAYDDEPFEEEGETICFQGQIASFIA
jgi:hypothetical protein